MDRRQNHFFFLNGSKFILKNKIQSIIFDRESPPELVLRDPESQYRKKISFPWNRQEIDYFYASGSPKHETESACVCVFVRVNKQHGGEVNSARTPII